MAVQDLRSVGLQGVEAETASCGLGPLAPLEARTIEVDICPRTSGPFVVESGFGLSPAGTSYANQAAGGGGRSA